MGSTFDIFKVTSDGPLWADAVQGLEKAKERMAQLALTSPGEYFIHSQEQGVIAKQATNFWKKYHDYSDLHDEVSPLRKHSIQGQA